MSDGARGAPGLDPDQLVGYEWDIELNFTVQYNVRLVAGIEQDDAVRAAEEVALYGPTAVSDRDLVHTDAEQRRPIYADDWEAEQVDWVEGPTAPSSDTYWDDRVHFPALDTEPADDGSGTGD